jgi:hypothetical protein
MTNKERQPEQQRNRQSQTDSETDRDAKRQRYKLGIIKFTIQYNKNREGD